MATETQRNFKKQMAQIQKELKNKNSEQYYSYVQDEHIESYYKNTSRRKIINISIGSIISTGLIIYSLYTWIWPVININNPNQYDIVTSPILQSNFNPITSNQKRIVSYLEAIQIHDNEVTSCINYANSNFQKAASDIGFRNQYVNNLNKNKALLQGKIISVTQLQCPADLSSYKETILDKYNTVYELTSFVSDAVAAKSGNTNIHMKSLTDKYNLSSKLQTEQLLNAFDSAHIKYTKNPDGSITYYVSQ